MEQHIENKAREFFLHLFNMVVLYTTLISLLVVLFQVINITVPDSLESSMYYSTDYYKTSLKAGLSTLIVFFPVQIAMAWFMMRRMEQIPAIRHMVIRRFLVGLTMFAAAVSIMIMLVTAVNRLLDGELTLRFSLKLLSMLVIGGLVLGYYLWDARNHKESKA